jgi:hypothetical protein
MKNGKILTIISYLLYTYSLSQIMVTGVCYASHNEPAEGPIFAVVFNFFGVFQFLVNEVDPMSSIG